MEKLTCSGANQFELMTYLASLGHHPQKITIQDYWYRSPFRDEKTASFKVNRKQNIWYDHGLGTSTLDISEIVQDSSTIRALRYSYSLE